MPLPPTPYLPLTGFDLSAYNNLPGFAAFAPRLGDLLNLLAEASVQSAQFDAFGRLRVSNPSTVFENKQVFNNGVPLQMAQKVVGAATITYVPAKAASTLALNGGGTDRAIRQSRPYINYFPGKSQLIDITFNLNGGEAGAVKRVGYFDDGNGIFLQQSPTTTALVLRSSTSGAPVDTVVAQADWNVDKLDGSGASGVTLDTTKAQILSIDFQWLGTGQVRCGFFIDNTFVTAHIFETANIGTMVYMTSPVLPVRWEIEALAAGSTATMDSVCCTVVSEGGSVDRAVFRSVSRGRTPRTTDDDPRALISVRLRDPDKRASVFLQALSILCTTNVNALWEIVVGGTFTGGVAPAWVAAGDFVEYDVTRDGVYNDNGVVIGSGYFSQDIDEAQVSAGNPTQQVPPLTMDVDGVPDEVHLIVRNASAASNDSYYGSITWLEQG